MYIMHLIQPDYDMIYYPMLQAVQFSDFETNPPVVTHLYNPSSEHVDLRGIESFSHTWRHGKVLVTFAGHGWS